MISQVMATDKVAIFVLKSAGLMKLKPHFGAVLTRVWAATSANAVDKHRLLVEIRRNRSNKGVKISVCIPIWN